MSKESIFKDNIKIVNARKIHAKLAGHHPEINNILNRIFHISSKPITISVMGEFSAGKSSFLNKLLGTDVLPVSILPKTATITRILYGNKNVIDIEYEYDGKVEIKSGLEYDSFQELQSAAKINDKAFQEKLEHIREVRVYIDNPLLKKFNLIDTPGFNHDLAMDKKSLKVLDETDLVIWIADYTQVAKKTEFEKLLLINKKVKQIQLIINKADVHVNGSESHVQAKYELSNSLGENKFLNFFKSNDLSLISCKSEEPFWDGVFRQFLAYLGETCLSQDLNISMILLDEQWEYLVRSLDNDYCLYDQLQKRVVNLQNINSANSIFEQKAKGFVRHFNSPIVDMKYKLFEHYKLFKKISSHFSKTSAVNVFIHEQSKQWIYDSFKKLQDKYCQYLTKIRRKHRSDIILHLKKILYLIPPHHYQEIDEVQQLLAFYRLQEGNPYLELKQTLPATSRTIEIIDQMGMQFLTKKSSELEIMIVPQIEQSILEDFMSDIENITIEPAINAILDHLSKICISSNKRLKTSLEIKG